MIAVVAERWTRHVLARRDQVICAYDIEAETFANLLDAVSSGDVKLQAQLWEMWKKAQTFREAAELALSSALALPACGDSAYSTATEVPAGANSDGMKTTWARKAP
jgi:hypothetical protein